MTRTAKQNAAMHKYFDLVASTFNANDITVQVVLKPDTTWTANGIKEFLWRTVQIANTGKTSSTKLTSDEVTAIYDILNKVISERYGLHIPFPHIEKEF